MWEHSLQTRVAEVVMTTWPRILCAVDFSDGSRGALRYAAILPEKFQSLLTVATIDDPLLASIDMARPSRGLADDTRHLLQRLVADTLGARRVAIQIDYVVGIGRPAEELLRIASDQRADLLVMSSHGLTGIRKLFFGSTAERVLRESAIPVLLTESVTHGPATWEDMVAEVNRVLVPVDLLPGSELHVRDALRIADTLGVPALITHVIEPTRLPFARRQHGLHIDAERRARADQAIEAMVDSATTSHRPEGLVAYGEPAEEIAKVARDRHAGLIVMGLRATGSPHGRMGSVTYRVLCVSHAMVLALPPAPNALGRLETAPGTFAQVAAPS
jgi:nucleotide-binding universal stress UspA family protein